MYKYTTDHVNRFQGYPKKWPGVNSLASSAPQSEKRPIVFPPKKAVIFGLFLEVNFPGQKFDFFTACHTYLKAIQCMSGLKWAILEQI